MAENAAVSSHPTRSALEGAIGAACHTLPVVAATRITSRRVELSHQGTKSWTSQD
jgi:hypothetical protein